MIEIIYLLILGWIAGIAAGLLGIGGGIIIVPGLIFINYLLNPLIILDVHEAIGTSLATIIFTGISSARAHHLKGGIDYETFLKLITGLILGSLIGAAVAVNLHERLLSMVVVAFLLLVGFRLIFQEVRFSSYYNKNLANLAAHGAWIGLLSSMLGIGGGTFIVPLLSAKGLEIRKAIGTSAMCGIPIAFFGCLGFILFNQDGMLSQYVNWSSALIMSLTSIIGARYGVRLVYKINQSYLKKIFGIFICIAALLVLFR